jgi:hypothetical protein
MDSSVSPKVEIWFLCLCHLILTAVYPQTCSAEIKHACNLTRAVYLCLSRGTIFFIYLWAFLLFCVHMFVIYSAKGYAKTVSHVVPPSLRIRISARVEWCSMHIGQCAVLRIPLTSIPIYGVYKFTLLNLVIMQN